jgi:Flp pilus assembly protein TadG
MHKQAPAADTKPAPSSRHVSGGLLRRFCRNTGGNIAVSFAIVILPLVAAVGCALDYAQANRIRTKLQSAADAASVASVSSKSAGYLAASAMLVNGPVPAGMAEANSVFNGNAGTITGYNSLSETSTVTKTGPSLASSVKFTAQVPVTFLKVMGWQTLTVTGTSSANSSLPLYLDFYLMLDVSGSMGLPSTSSEQTRLATINPDNYVQYPTGCTLACHFTPQNSACTDSGTQQYPTNNYCMGYAYSRVSQSALTSLVSMKSTRSVPKQVPGLPTSMISGLPASLNTDPTWGMSAVSSCATPGTDSCIQLRADAVGYAVNQLFSTANATEKVANQFRIGLYPFIQNLYAYFPLTSSIDGSATNSSTINYAAANLASQLDTNTNGNLGSGGTHIDTAFSTMNSTILSVGDGSSAVSTLPYVFLITDGAQDPQTKGVNSGAWSGSNHATVIDPATVCASLKSRGIIVSVLYIPYAPIQNPNPSFANDEDDYANNNIPSIPPSLQTCASSGYFYTANTPADITTALNAMFNHALLTAHITN